MNKTTIFIAGIYAVAGFPAMLALFLVLQGVQLVNSVTGIRAFSCVTIVADVHAVLVLAGVRGVAGVSALHVTGVMPVASVSRFKPNF